MDIQLMFFFSALGAFNGLIMGIYFLFCTKSKHPSNLFFGLFILALSVRVGKSVFFYFNSNLADVYIQIGLFSCWLIGPLLYFYVRTALETNFNYTKNSYIHFIPLVVFGLFLFVFFLNNQNEKYWETYIKLVYLVWLTYSVIAFYLFWTSKEKLKHFEKKRYSFKLWLSSIVYGNLIICVAFISANYTSYIVGALSFTFLFYLLLLLLFSKGIKGVINLNVDNKKSHLKKINNSKIELSETEANNLIPILKELIEKDKIYLDTDLSLTKLAQEMETSNKKLSILINEYLESSFYDYINQFRVEETKIMLLDKNCRLSIDGIAKECGFKSRSSFYKVFKSIVGQTPAQFKKQNE